MCGIVGIVSQTPVNQLIYDALQLLQHRGQDAPVLPPAVTASSRCSRQMVWSETFSVPGICARCPETAVSAMSVTDSRFCQE